MGKFTLNLVTLTVLIILAACSQKTAPGTAAPGSAVPALNPVSAVPERTPTSMPETPFPTLALTVAALTVTPPSAAGDPRAGFSLQGRVFFDHNGDGLLDTDEPGIAGVRLCLLVPGEGTCEQSDQNGVYRFDNLTAGTYGLRLEPAAGDPHGMYRYVMLSEGYVDVPAYYANGERVAKQYLPDVKVASIEDHLEVNVDGDTALDVALTQGYLTDPFACRDRGRITETHAFDLDPQKGTVRDYKGESSMAFTSNGRITDNHRAIDWGNSNRSVIGIQVRAAAPGIVAFVGEDYTTHGNCRMVTLAHPDTGHKTGYVHLEKILVNDRQKVQRGQVLGTLGDSCTEWPHLHFTFNTGWQPGSADFSNVNPYRDTLDPLSSTWWTVDNDPVCLELE